MKANWSRYKMSTKKGIDSTREKAGKIKLSLSPILD